MKNKTLYLLWGLGFIICCLLGFIPAPQGFLKVLLILSAAAFFVPGWIILYQADRNRDVENLKLIRGLSLVSLGGTLIFLVLNFLSGRGSVFAGDLLYSFLVIFSTPMVCSQYWVASIFIWACLLITSISSLKKAKK